MPVANLHLLTIEQAAAGLAAGEFTSLELTDACLAQIERLDSRLNSYVRVDTELARRQAAESDARRAAGTARGLLDGIPYNLKDIYATKESPTTASSHMLEDWLAPYDATVYRRLCDAGAVLLGKTNTDEFTMGASSETSYFGVTRNPWDTERVAGGSSGGPAAAMAAHLGIFSIGTDTGGSIRLPAAFCGVTGLRPTYGRISRFGEIPMASSLDQTGPITKTVRDSAIVLQVLSGQDQNDATSLPDPVPDYLGAIKAMPADKPLSGMRVGQPAEYFGEGVLPEVESLVRAAASQLESLGATLVELSIPASVYALAAYYIICPAEVSSNMMRYDGIRYGHSVEREEHSEKLSLYDVYAKSRSQGIGAEVQRRIMLGAHVLSSGYHDAYYLKAEQVRQEVRRQFAEAFEQVDVLAAPVSPHTAFRIGENSGNPLAMYKEDVLVCPLNIGGIPGISVPCGFAEGLPVGLQLMAGRLQEEKLLQVAAAYQAATDHHTKHPALINA